MSAASNIVIYVGEEHAVVHALLEWGEGVSGLTHIDGGDHVRLLEFSGGGLFGGPGYAIVENVEHVPLEVLARVGPGVHLAGGVVRRDSKLTKALKTLSDVVDVVALDRRWIERELTTMFTRRGVTLEPAARKLIAERCSEDLSKARSVAVIAAMAGIDRLGLVRCQQLLGTGRRDSKTYEVVDALLDGARQQALEKASSIEAIPLTIALSETLRQVIAAGELPSAEVVAAKLGIHPYAAKRRVGHHRRWGTTALYNALAVACRVEVAARRGTMGSGEALARVVIALEDLTTG